jgi:hypothetical protein
LAKDRKFQSIIGISCVPHGPEGQFPSIDKREIGFEVIDEGPRGSPVDFRHVGDSGKERDRRNKEGKRRRVRSSDILS